MGRFPNKLTVGGLAVGGGSSNALAHFQPSVRLHRTACDSALPMDGPAREAI